MTRTLSLLIAAASLAGCASLNSLTSEVSSYSQWPADRKPGSYAFERLPSQQNEWQTRVEAWADPALFAADGSGSSLAGTLLDDPTAQAAGEEATPTLEPLAEVAPFGNVAQLAVEPTVLRPVVASATPTPVSSRSISRSSSRITRAR